MKVLQHALSRYVYNRSLFVIFTYYVLLDPVLDQSQYRSFTDTLHYSHVNYLRFTVTRWGFRATILFNKERLGHSHHEFNRKYWSGIKKKMNFQMRYASPRCALP